MKLLLLCLGLTLVWAHEEGHSDVVTSNFDFSKISGKWYTILMASDEMERIEENGIWRAFMENIEVFNNSTFFFEFQKRENGQCVNRTLVGYETKLDGVYRVVYYGYVMFRVIEAAYGEYVIFHTVSFDNRKEVQLMMLYGQEPDLRPEIKTRFGQICQKHGMYEENIIDATKVADRCLQTRGSVLAQFFRSRSPSHPQIFGHNILL
ncbi:allergen Fel d 4-like isoform 1-T1 [Hipposideros larvatus]